jgi:hypothetical protein
MLVSLTCYLLVYFAILVIHHITVIVASFIGFLENWNRNLNVLPLYQSHLYCDMQSGHTVMWNKNSYHVCNTVYHHLNILSLYVQSSVVIKFPENNVRPAKTLPKTYVVAEEVSALKSYDNPDCCYCKGDCNRCVMPQCTTSVVTGDFFYIHTKHRLW